MIENMRKYTGLMIVVLVLLAAGLIFTLGNFNAGSGVGTPVTSVYGEDVGRADFRKMSYGTFKVIKAATDPTQPYGILMNPLARYAGELGAPGVIYGSQGDGKEALNFVVSRIVIKKEAAKLGLYPSAERAREYIESTLFAKEGKFDAQRYNEFIKFIGETGYKEKDFIQLVGEFALYSKLRGIIAGNIPVSTKDTKNQALYALQTLELSTIELDLETYKKQVKPTEEQIKTFWTENEGRYQTERQLKLSYFIARPKFKTPAPVLAERKEGMKDEEFAKIQEAFNKEYAAWQIKKEESDNALAVVIDDFSLEFDTKTDFDAVVKENGFDLKKTEFFTLKNIPADLKEEMAAPNEDGEKRPITEVFFEMALGSGEKDQIKDPIKLSDGGWIYAKLDAEVAAKPKTYEEAKELAKADYLEIEGHKAMKKAADELKTKLAEAVKDGKTIAEAAKANGLTAKLHTGIVQPNRGSSPQSAKMFQYGSITNPGLFSENNIEEQDKLTLVFLHKRVVYKTPENEMAVLGAPDKSAAQLSYSIFQAWLKNAKNQANVPKMNE